jgi:hypothetical protein
MVDPGWKTYVEMARDLKWKRPDEVGRIELEAEKWEAFFGEQYQRGWIPAVREGIDEDHFLAAGIPVFRGAA